MACCVSLLCGGGGAPGGAAVGVVKRVPVGRRHPGHGSAAPPRTCTSLGHRHGLSAPWTMIP